MNWVWGMWSISFILIVFSSSSAPNSVLRCTGLKIKLLRLTKLATCIDHRIITCLHFEQNIASFRVSNSFCLVFNMNPMLYFRKNMHLEEFCKIIEYSEGNVSIWIPPIQRPVCYASDIFKACIYQTFELTLCHRMDDLWAFLRSRNVLEETIQQMEKDKVVSFWKEWIQWINHTLTLIFIIHQHYRSMAGILCCRLLFPQRSGASRGQELQK